MNHSINQVCKIMYFYDIAYDDFHNFFIHDFEEKTNVFSYYVLKSALLFELPLFIKLIGYNLEINNDNLPIFIHLVEMSFKSTKYNKILLNCLNRYKNINKSLRMTITDI